MFIFNQTQKSDCPLRWVTLGMLFGMGVLWVGLWYLQVVSSHRYVESQHTQSLRRVRYPALRGNILDRNGVVLAENRPSYNINLYLEELSELFRAEYRQLTGKRRLTKAQREALGRQARYQVVSNIVYQVGTLLQQPLQLDEPVFRKHYAQRLILPLPILENLTAEQIARFEEQPEKAPGLSLDIQRLRVYPHQSLAAHVLGNLRRTEQLDDDMGTDPETFESIPGLPDYEGRVGIEAVFDDDLRGHPGLKSVLINNLGYRQTESIWSPAEPGRNVILTLDARIQRVAEKVMRDNHYKGAVVVMDPRNGDLLALVSAPTYDPNVFIPRLSTTEWQKLTDTNLWPVPHWKPMFNRATFGAYAPGSIFKIVVALAALESGDLDPQAICHSPGYFPLSRTKVIDDTAAAGEYNLRRAFLKSSNFYFITNGLKTGVVNIMNMAERFCLGQRTQVPIRQEVSGFIPTPDWMQERKDKGEPLRLGDRAMLCFGQGYMTVTPIQMAVMTAAVANGGKVLWPRLVDRIVPRDPGSGEPVKVFATRQVRAELGVQSRHLALIREAMLADVEDHEGTGRRASVVGWRVCGKTGTAENKEDGRVVRKDTWFVSYAPYENPRYVVVVLVEGGGSGGNTCAPLAQSIYEAIKRLETNQGAAPGALAQN